MSFLNSGTDMAKNIGVSAANAVKTDADLKAQGRVDEANNAELSASNDTIKNNYRKSRSSNMLFKSSGEAGVSRKTLLGG